MEFGLQVANLEWSELRDVARTAEELGFHLITFPDHIVMEGLGGRYDPRALSYDPMIVAAVACEATKRIRVGHLVLCNLFRHPAIAAQSLVSLDRLSGGRLVAGFGTGWTEREFRMTGIPFPDIAARLRMLDEALTCVRALWTREVTTFEGEFYRFRDAILSPKPVQKPHLPLLLGGGGRGLLRIAARHADVVNITSETGKAGKIEAKEVARLTDERYRAKIRFLREEARSAGRDPGSIRLSNVIFTVIVTGSPAETSATCERIAPALGMSPHSFRLSPLALVGTPEEMAAELSRRKREWEISQFIFSGGSEKFMRRLAEEVLPHV